MFGYRAKLFVLEQALPSTYEELEYRKLRMSRELSGNRHNHDLKNHHNQLLPPIITTYDHHHQPLML